MSIHVSVGSCHLNTINMYSRSGNIIEHQANCHSLQGSTLILGDFNLHHPYWGTPAAIRACEVFVECLNISSFSIINTTKKIHKAPNELRTLFDLSICSSAFLPRLHFPLEDVSFGSDNFPIYLALDSSKKDYTACEILC